jgi:ABC-type transport system involved in multi-copper enzyme maturation permease subunit
MTSGCVPVSAGQALLVVLVWALVLGGISTYMFIKRDVLQ